jgi:hypothetical protein
MKLNELTIKEIFSDDDEWGSMHDAILDPLYSDPNRKDDINITKEICIALFKKLDSHDQHLAHEWGLGDTPFRDNVYQWTNKHKNKGWFIEILDWRL